MDDGLWFTSGELASLLVDGRRQRDRAEAEWLAWLAEFDTQGGWAIYGCLNCLNWLIQHCGMCRPTAKDKLRVALQLRQRRVFRNALVSGRLSYFQSTSAHQDPVHVRRLRRGKRDQGGRAHRRRCRAD